MKNDLCDPDLERRFRVALAEMMPHLETLDDRATPPQSRQHDDSATLTPIRRGSAARPRRPIGVIAASVLVVAGAGGAAVVVARGSAKVDGSAAVSVSDPPVSDPLVDHTRGPLLASALSADANPMVVLADPSWSLTGWSEVEALPNATPTSECAGCGAERLIVAADGPLFAGPMFTAWAISEPYDITHFEFPGHVGTIEARYELSDDAVPPGHFGQLRIVWPIGDGRTAFVDATGLDADQVFSMAASLTFEGSVPTLQNLPVGLSVRPTPPRGEMKQVYLQYTDTERTVPGYEGNSAIELIALSGGLQSLVDWRNLSGDPFGNPWVPARVDGVDVLLDDSGVTARSPVLSVSATWVAGDWASVAIGHVFNDTQEFLDALTQLQLTDSATFANATAAAEPFTMDIIEREVDGSGGVLISREPG